MNLLDVAVYLQSTPLAEFSVSGQQHRQEDYVARFPAVGIFNAADGPFFLAAYWEKDWPQLCRVLGRPELVYDSRLLTTSLEDARAAVEHPRRESMSAEDRNPGQMLRASSGTAHAPALAELRAALGGSDRPPDIQVLSGVPGGTAEQGAF